MNWKTFVEKKNAKTFVLPEGWDSRDEVANQLDCSPEKVDDNLRPALKSGEVVKQQFKVWDNNLKRLVFVVAYQAAKAQPAPAVAADVDAMKKMKKDGKTYAEIGSLVGRTGEAVRSILRKS